MDYALLERLSNRGRRQVLIHQVRHSEAQLYSSVVRPATPLGPGGKLLSVAQITKILQNSGCEVLLTGAPLSNCFSSKTLNPYNLLKLRKISSNCELIIDDMIIDD